MARPLHQRIHPAALFDNLRQEPGRNGAWKSPTPQSEVPIIASSFYAGMDSSGLGQASSSGRAGRTYGGGGITPQTYTTTPGGPNSDEHLADVGKAMNARATNPSRGLDARSPLMRRR